MVSNHTCASEWRNWQPPSECQRQHRWQLPGLPGQPTHPTSPRKVLTTGGWRRSAWKRSRHHPGSWDTRPQAKRSNLSFNLMLKYKSNSLAPKHVPAPVPVSQARTWTIYNLGDCKLQPWLSWTPRAGQSLTQVERLWQSAKENTC